MLGYANSAQKSHVKFNRQINEVRKYWQTHTAEGFKETETKLKKVEKTLLSKLHEFNHANGLLEDKMAGLTTNYIQMRRELTSATNQTHALHIKDDPKAAAGYSMD